MNILILFFCLISLAYAAQGDGQLRTRVGNGVIASGASTVQCNMS